jgi:hypothetical protein
MLNLKCLPFVLFIKQLEEGFFRLTTKVFFNLIQMSKKNL